MLQSLSLPSALRARCLVRWGASWPAVVAARQRAVGGLTAADLEQCLRHESGLGDPQGVAEAIFRAYQARMLGRALRLVHTRLKSADAALAEDVVQRSLIRIRSRFTRARAGQARHVIPESLSALPYLAYWAAVLPSALADVVPDPGSERSRQVRADLAQCDAELAAVQACIDERVRALVLEEGLPSRSAMPGLRRLALYLSHGRRLYGDDILGLLGLHPHFMSNLRARQGKLLRAAFAADPELAELLREHAELAETRQRLVAERADVRKIRARIRELEDELRTLRADPNAPPGVIAELEAELARLRALLDPMHAAIALDPELDGELAPPDSDVDGEETWTDKEPAE